MYCGSCMLDNALVRAMIRQGHDALLVPVYTPIRTDDEDVSLDRVFLGGVNVYLQQKFSWLRFLPRRFDAFLNQPWLIQKMTANAGNPSPHLLGSLAVSMLKGTDGNQRKEVIRLCDWLEKEIRPDALLLTNLLIGGCIAEFKRRIKAPVLVTLQGDDIFLDSLPDIYRQPAVVAMRRLVSDVDGFIVHSHDYGNRMAELLHIPIQKLHVVPLGIDTQDFKIEGASQLKRHGEADPIQPTSKVLSIDVHRSKCTELNDVEAMNPVEAIHSAKLNKPITIGYFARMAPEKGLHLLIDAFIELTRKTQNNDVNLCMAGWMGPQHASYWNEQQAKLKQANLAGRWSYRGSLARREKLGFFRGIDLFSVPTTYQEPKGIFLLEAAAAGVPYVQPAHGAFPELHQRLASGWLYPAGNQQAYINQLESSVDKIRMCKDLSSKESKESIDLKTVWNEVSIEQMANRVLDLVMQSTSKHSA